MAACPRASASLPWSWPIRFDGAGGGAWDENKRDAFHGPGPSSQIAIFTRRGMAAVAQKVPPEPLDERLPVPTVVWLSEALETAAAATAPMRTTEPSGLVQDPF